MDCNTTQRNKTDNTMDRNTTQHNTTDTTQQNSPQHNKTGNKKLCTYAKQTSRGNVALDQKLHRQKRSKMLQVYQNLVSIHCFFPVKMSVFGHFFIVHHVSPMPEVTFEENLSVKLVFWSTNTVGYLYSFWVLFVLY